jgi:hypothetical protein
MRRMKAVDEDQLMGVIRRTVPRGDGSNTMNELSLMNLIAYRRGGRKMHTEGPKNDAATGVFVRVPWGALPAVAGGPLPIQIISLEEILR